LKWSAAKYEKEFGAVNVGEYFRLVVDHPQFAWLHNISEFVVRIDETLTGDAPVMPRMQIRRSRWHKKCLRPQRKATASSKNILMRFRAIRTS